MQRDVVRVEVVAAAVIKKDERYLLVQEKQKRAYGLWNFPAGRVDVGDTIEQTAVKEAKEETGYDVALVRKLIVHQDTANESVKHAFEANIIGGELLFPKDEILDAQWFTVDEIRKMKDRLRNAYIMAAIVVMEARALDKKT